MAENRSVTDEEIDIGYIFKLLWNKKYWIALFVGLVSVAAVVISLNMDNIYESKAVMRPSQNNTGKMSSLASNFGGLANLAGISINNDGAVSPYNTLNAILNNGDFLSNFVIKNGYEVMIFDDYEKLSKTDRYKNNRKAEIKKVLNGNLFFSEDKKTSVMTLVYQDKNREFAKDFVNKLLSEMSSRYKAIELNNIKQKIDNYKNEISNTQDLTIRNSLAEVVSGLIQTKIISQAQEYYGFDILVRPVVSDSIDKVKPRRSIICISAFLASLGTAIFSVIAYDKLKNNKIG